MDDWTAKGMELFFYRCHFLQVQQFVGGQIAQGPPCALKFVNFCNEQQYFRGDFKILCLHGKPYFYP